MAYSLFLLLLLMVVKITQTTKELYKNTPNSAFEDFSFRKIH